VSSKEGTFFKEGWHKSREKFSVRFWAELIFCCGRLYSPYDSVQSYGFGMEIEAFWGTIFEVDFKILVVVYGSYGTVHTVVCGHKNRGTEQVVQQYHFGMENEADFYGTVLVM
jgi:hypothetical protein